MLHGVIAQLPSRKEATAKQDTDQKRLSCDPERQEEERNEPAVVVLEPADTQEKKSLQVSEPAVQSRATKNENWIKTRKRAKEEREKK